MMRILLLILGLLGGATLAPATIAFGFQLIPASGDLSAAPGATVGWGYTVTNPETEFWLAPYSLDTDTFLSGTPNSLFLFPILGPGASLTVPYDSLDGLYEFTWDPLVPLGTVNLGFFIISAEWYVGNPLEGGELWNLGIEQRPYSVTAASLDGGGGGGGDGEPGEIPEPGTLLLTGMAVTTVLVCRRNGTS